MPAPEVYPQALRDRAMRLVNEARNEDPGLSTAPDVVRLDQRTWVCPE